MEGENNVEAKRNSIPKISPLLIPKTFATIAQEDLLQIFKEKPESLVIFDVRGIDYPGGHIPSSVHVPNEEFENEVDTLIEQHGNKQNIVFACMWGKLRSPECALRFIQRSSNKDNVFVMSDGLRDWIQKYHDDKELVENFDKECWSEEFFHQSDTEGTPRSKANK
eukprot:TRINITY_DN13582_c0_g1_i1.p1 TRINITY_DN13582_c0_g1~~TRINITY_DN13582_c0_g1_i1.p1  ORF type:complete len:166 (+),score=27.80 TRINITY_DN13582_c0_g1_i1:97-594(+)